MRRYRTVVVVGSGVGGGNRNVHPPRQQIATELREQSNACGTLDFTEIADGDASRRSNLFLLHNWGRVKVHTLPIDHRLRAGRAARPLPEEGMAATVGSPGSRLAWQLLEITFALGVHELRGVTYRMKDARAPADLLNGLAVQRTSVLRVTGPH
jgi:hypothetical protein